MAKAEAVWEVRVTSSGMKVTQKQSDDLGKSVERTNKRTREADSASKDFYNTQAKGVIGTANSTKSFSKMAETIGGGGGGLVAAYATLAANVFAVSAAFNALRSATQAELVLKGLEEQGARTGRTLTVAAQRLQEVVRFSISSRDAMEATAMFTATGFSTTELERLGKVAENTSLALGRNLPDSLDRLIKGTTKLEPELLDELGIMTKLGDATAEYALQINKPVSALTQFEKRQAFLNAVLEEGESKFDGLSEAIDPNVYDRLASSFNNLSTYITKAIASSTLLKGAITVLIDSTTGLLGVLTVFGAYIASKYTNSLRLSSAASLKEAKALKEKAKALQEHTRSRMGDTKAILDNAKADTQAAISLGRTQRGKAAKVQQEALGGDTSAQEKLIKSREASTKRYEKELKKIEGLDDERSIKRRANINNEIQANNLIIKQTQELIKAEMAYSAAQANTSQNVLRTKAAEQASLAQGRAALAMEAAAVGKVGQAYKNVIASTANYSKSLKLTAEASRNAAAAAAANGKSTVFMASTMNLVAPAALKARVAIHALTLSVKALGVAFSTLLPWIGVALMVWGLLESVYTAAYKFFFPKTAAAKENLANKTEALNEILERTAETGKKTSAVFADNTRSALDAATAFTALSNTVNEVSDAFKAVEQARAQLNAGESATAETLLESAFEKAGKELSSKVVDSEAFQAVQALTKLGYAPLNKEIMDATVNSKEFQKASAPEQINILARTLDRAQKRFGSVGTAVEEVRNNFRALNEATANFVNSATPSTPYDNLVDNLTTSRVAVLNLEAELAKGTISSEDFYKQILDLGPAATALFVSGTQEQIESLKDLELAIKQGNEKLKEMQEGSIDASKYSEVLKQVQKWESQIAVERQKVGAIVAKSLEDEQKRFLELQRQSVVIQGMLKLEQARLSTVKQSLSDTGAGYQVLVSQEEKLRQMQVTKIRAEQAVLKNLNSQQELKLSMLRTEEKALQAKLNGLKIDAESLGLLERVTNKLKELLGIETPTEDLEANLKTLKATIVGVEAEVNKLGNAIESLDYDVAAILAENLTEAQKAAERINLDFKTTQRLGDRIRAATLDRLSFEERILSLGNRRLGLNRVVRIEALRELQISIARFNREKASAEQSRQNLENEIKTQLIKLEADRDRVGALSEEGKAISVNIAFREKELEIVRQVGELQEDIIKGNLTLELAQKFRIDTLNKGLEIQQDAVNLLQKEYDLKRDLLSQEKEIALTRARILVGNKVTPALERSIEAKAAADQYKLAVEQFGLRMAAIDAEYAILEAQRLQLEYNLKAQQAFLEAQAELTPGGVTAEQREGLSQLSNAIDMLGGVDYGVLKETAQSTERATLELLRLRAQEARGTAGGLFIGLSGAAIQGASIFKNLKDSSQTLAKATNKAKEPFDNITKVVLPDFAEATVNAEKALSEFTTQVRGLDFAIPELESKLNNIVEAFNDFLVKLTNQGGVSSAASNMGKIVGRTPDSMVSTMRIAKDMAEASGAVWSRYGAQTGHKGSGHREYRAIDVNMAPGTGEIANPAILARMNALATQYAEKGFIVLWNKYRYSLDEAGRVITTAIAKGQHQHTDHMHVEAQKSGVVIRESIEEAGHKVASVVKEAIIEAVDTSLPPSQRGNREVPNISILSAADDSLPSVGLEGAPITVSVQKAKASIGDFLQAATPSVTEFIEKFESLGPEGEVMSAVLGGFLNFGETLTATFTAINMSTSEMSEALGRTLTETEAQMIKISTGLSALASGIGMVNQILQATSRARIAEIDREIAAEQKRDGKSQQSVELLQKLETKKDAIARKAFETNKKLMIAQAVMSTAAGIAGALAAQPVGPWNIALAALIGAMGAAQIAVIAGTQYQSNASNAAVQPPSTLSIGRRGDTVDLARGPSANAGGEAGFVRGQQGFGSNANNFRTIGSAYGGELMRGYGNRGFVVGEKGPEVITPETPINVTPANDVMPQQPLNATFNIQALDASGVEDLLVAQKGNIISMLRSAANAAGQGFLEDVNTNIYTRPSVNKL
jgi:hypothetical protein